MGILPSPDFLELSQRHEASLFSRSGIDRTQGGDNRLAILSGHLRQLIPDLVNEATLDFGLRVHGSDRFREAGQPIHCKNKHIVDVTVLELIERPKPVPGGLTLSKPDAQSPLFSFPVNADHQVRGLASKFSLLRSGIRFPPAEMRLLQVNA